MKRWSALLLGLCACAATGHSRVVVEYTRETPLDRVTVEAVNATGRDLPMPPAGLVEQAVRAVTQQAEPQTTIPDAFARAASERLGQMNVRVVAAGAALHRLRVSLTGWDVTDGGATGAVAFVSADYQLLDERGELSWQVTQTHLPVRLSGPNLSRDEIGRVAQASVERALASLPGPSSGH